MFKCEILPLYFITQIFWFFFIRYNFYEILVVRLDGN